MKKVKFLAIFLCFLSISVIFCGCTSGHVSLFFTSLPNKICYELNEEVNFNGVKVEALNTDGTTTALFLKDDDFEQVDTSTYGEKTVVLNKDNLTATFKIYVANVIVNNKDELKSKIENCNNGDIVYIKQGEYKPENITDDSLYNILINKKITLVGDGKSKSIIHGNFILGATKVLDSFLPSENFEDVKFINLGFKLSSTLNNKFNTFEGPYGSFDLFGAIKTNKTTKIIISNCIFDGYSYGINADIIDNLTITKCMFKNIKINAIRVSQNIKNSSIVNCQFMDIGNNSLVLENTSQGNVGAIYLSFAEKNNAGVIVANNSFARIGLKQGDLVYNSPGADELETGNFDLTSGSYINNSAIIFLVSNNEKNLDVQGIILSNNNYGSTLKNISFGTNSENLINQAGVYINGD